MLGMTLHRIKRMGFLTVFRMTLHSIIRVGFLTAFGMTACPVKMGREEGRLRRRSFLPLRPASACHFERSEKPPHKTNARHFERSEKPPHKTNSVISSAARKLIFKLYVERFF